MSGDLNFMVDFLSKLNHPLEEVRTRALKNISNKIDRKIINIDDLCNYKEFIPYLLEWFNRDTINSYNLVLKLIKLASFTQTGAKHILRVGGVEFLSQLRICSKSPELIRQIDDILDNIFKTGPTNKLTTTIDVAPCIYSPKKLSQHKTVIPAVNHQKIGYFDNSLSSVANNPIELQGDFEPDKDDTFKLSVHPIIPLTSTDKKVLGGSLGTLRSDDFRVVTSGIQFFTNVILEDFPATVFLQRQGATKILNQFLSERQYSIAAAKALRKLCEKLISYIDVCLDPNFFSTKNTFAIIKQDSGGFEEECSWMRDELMDLHYEPNMAMPTQLPVPVFALQLISGCLQQFSQLDTDINWVDFFQLLYASLRLLRTSFGGDLRRPALWDLWNIAEYLSDQLELCSKLLVQYSETENVDSVRLVNNKQVYLGLFSVFWELVSGFYSPEMALKYLPSSAKTELARALLDSSLHFGLGEKLSPLVDYVQLLDQTVAKIHRESEIMMHSASSLITFFLHNNEPIKYAEVCITAAVDSLQCLDHFYGVRFCKEFVHFFSLICSTEIFLDRQDMFVSCEDILIQLLKSQTLCKLTFAEIFEIVKGCLSIDELSKPKSGADRKLNFILRLEVFKSLVIYGLYSKVPEILETCSTLFCRIWDSQGMLSPTNWKTVDTVTKECMLFLQPLADTSSRLGRQIVKMSVTVTDQLNLVNLLPLCYNKKDSVRKEAVQQLEQFLRKNRTWDCQVNVSNMADFLILSDSDNKHDRWFTSRSTSYIKSFDLEIENFQKVFDIYLANNIDIAVRKSAAEQLAIFLQMPNMHAYFISHGGLHFVLDMIKGKCLDKCQMSVLIPSTVLILLRVVQQKTEIRDALRRDSDLVDCLFQMAMYFCYDKQCLADISTILALAIFNSVIRQEKNGFDILVPDIFNDRLKLPFRSCVYKMVDFPQNVSCLHDIGSMANQKWNYKDSFESNLRIQWNVLKHGGLENYLSYKYSFLGKRMSTAEDNNELLEGILEPNDRHMMTEHDLYTFNNSIPQMILYDSLQKIDNAINHVQVQNNLLAIQLILLLSQNQSITINLQDLFLDSSVWISSIKKFLLNIPSCSADYTVLELTMDVLELVVTQPLTVNSSVDHFIKWIVQILTVPNNSLLYSLQKGDQIIGKTDSRRLTLAKNKLELRLPTFFALLLRFLNFNLYNSTQTYDDVANDIAQLHTIVYGLTLKRLKRYVLVPFDNLSMLLSWVQLMSVCLEFRSDTDHATKQQTVTDCSSLCSELIVKFQNNREEGSITFMGTAVIRYLLKIVMDLICDLGDGDGDRGVDCAVSRSGWLRKSPWLLELIGYRSVEIRAMSVALMNRLVQFDATRMVLFQQCSELLPESLWYVALTLFCDSSEAAIVRSQAIAILHNLCARTPINNSLEIGYDETSCHLIDKCTPVFVDHESSVQYLGIEGLYKILLYQDFFRKLGVVLTNFYTFPWVNTNHMKQSPLYDPERNVRSLKTDSVPVNVNKTLHQLNFGSAMNISTPMMVSSLMGFLCSLSFYLPTQISNQFSELRINTLIMNLLDPKLLSHYLECADRYSSMTAIDLLSTFKYSLKLIRLQISLDSGLRDSFVMDEKFMVTLVQLVMATNLKKDKSQPCVWKNLLDYLKHVTSFQVELVTLFVAMVVPVPSRSQLQLMIAHLSCHVQGMFGCIQTMFLSKNKAANTVAMQFVSLFTSLDFKDLKPNVLVTALETHKLPDSDLLIIEDIVEMLLKRREKCNGSHSTTKQYSDLSTNDRVAAHCTLKILLGVSKVAKSYLVKVGFIESAIVEIKYLHTRLDQCAHNKANSDKTSLWKSLMKELISVLELLQNLFYDDVNTQNIGISSGFPNTIYRLWSLALTDSDLMNSILNCLINFSADCPRSARSLVNCHQTVQFNDQPLSVGSSVSLIDNLCRLSSADVAAYNCRELTVKLIFRLLANLVWCPEAVNFVLRSRFLEKYEQINPNQLQKSTAGIQIQHLWIGLLTSLSFTEEGQNALMKINGSAIINILKLQNRIPIFKSSTLLVLRNLCTHPVIKVKLVVDGSGLIDNITQCLDSTNVYIRQLALSSLKALLYSNKKIRAHLKSANVVSKLSMLREGFENDSKNSLLPDIITLINVFQESQEFRTK